MKGDNKMSTKLENDNTQDIIDIVSVIEAHRKIAFQKVNEELITMYYEIGKYLSKKVKEEKWGSKVIENISKEIKNKYPTLKGFERKGLYRMIQFYETYIGNEIVSTLLTQISWSNNVMIISSTRSMEEKEFYIRMCIKNNYSTRELNRQITSGYYQRYILSNGNALESIEKAIDDDDLPNTKILDSYSLEFLDLPNKYSEKDLRKAIVKNLKVFIDRNHTQMKNWFSDYNIVYDAKFADVAIFHGTNYFGTPSTTEYINEILNANIPIISIEDTFLRSVFPCRTKCDKKFKDSIGYCINNYLYFESNELTTIKELLSKPYAKNEKEIIAGKNIINQIISNKISKYNCQNFIGNTNVRSMYTNNIIVIDQAFADQSIVNSNANVETFKQMLIAAVRENPKNKVCVKVHPESMTGGRAGFYTPELIKEVEKLTNTKIYKLTEPINPIILLQNARKIYTCSSGLGFEALMCNKPVVCFGAPFYAGFGLTDDRNSNTKFIQKIPIEYMAYIVFEKFSFFRHPITNVKMTTLEAINYIKQLRDSYFRK